MSSASQGGPGIGPSFQPHQPIVQGTPPQPQQQQATFNSSPIRIVTENQNAFRLLLILSILACTVMQKIFTWGAPLKNDLQTLKEYLINKGTTNRQYKQAFNKTLRDKIKLDPSCCSFDINLWFLAIKWGCDRLAAPDDESIWLSSPDTLENHLTEIKNFRNNIMHNDLLIDTQTFLNKCEEIRNLLIKTLEKARDKYSIARADINVLIHDLNTSIRYISVTPLTQMDSYIYENLSTVLLEVAFRNMVTRFEGISHVNPASMIVGSNKLLKVKNIFSELHIRSSGRDDKPESIDQNDLLKHVHDKKKSSDRGISHVLLIEGDAGAGKSTLIKFLLSDWISDNTLVKELSHYKFLIDVQCRSHTYESFTDLISDKLPTVRAQFHEGIHMKKWILDHPCLILVDGLDEKNTKSEKLFEEIINLSHNGNVLVLCTSRPLEIDNYYNTYPDNKTTHIKIKGIPETSRETFVRRYHDELIQAGFSKRNTDDLVHYVKSTAAKIMNFLQLPLNLTLLIVLWTTDPAGINSLTTVTELYTQVHELILNRLFQRLYTPGKAKIKPKEFKRKLRIFVEALSLEALKGLRDDVLILRENALDHIKAACKDLDLPVPAGEITVIVYELLDAFLIRENTWEAMDMNDYSSFPHKSNQEYYASRYIYMKSEDDPERSITNIFEELEIKDFTKYQMVLISLIGYHFHLKSEVKKSTVKELIYLLKKSGVKDRKDWINVLNQTKCNENLAQEICSMNSGIMVGKAKITDGNVSAYTTLLKLNLPQIVTISDDGIPSEVPQLEECIGPLSLSLNANPSEVPRLEECLGILSTYESKVNTLRLWFSFYHPNHSFASTSLETALIQLLKKCKVEDYKGCMTELPCTLSGVEVSVGQDGTSYKRLQEYLQSRRNALRRLRVCVPVNIDLTGVTPLFSSRIVPYLYISDVTNNVIKEAVEVAKKIQPTTGEKKFWTIGLPRSTLDGTQQKEFIRCLKTEAVCLEMVLSFPSSCRPSSAQEREEVNELAKKELRCQKVDWLHYLDL